MCGDRFARSAGEMVLGIAGCIHKEWNDPCIETGILCSSLILNVGRLLISRGTRGHVFCHNTSTTFAANNLIFFTWNSRSMGCERRRVLAAAAVISVASFCDSGT